MGERVLCGPGDKEQLTFASNGMVDADMLAYPADEVVKRNVVAELQEEILGEKPDVGVGPISFHGLMVDTIMFTGAFGIVNSLELPLTVREIEELRKTAVDGSEIDRFYYVGDSAGAIAEFLKEKRDCCIPQLTSGLVMYGYNTYGKEFLKAVTP